MELTAQMVVVNSGGNFYDGGMKNPESTMISCNDGFQPSSLYYGSTRRGDSRLDAGIALAHLYVANEETFRFFKAEKMPDLPGYGYIGSVIL